MTHASAQLPVLIVGTGPVGLFQAHALAQLGVPVIILGRHATRLGAPKAHALSPRSLEICRQFDISVNEIRSYPAHREDARWVRFVTSLSGDEVGCLPYERMSLNVLDASPEMLHNIAQPDFEDILMRRLEENPRVDLRKGWTWLRATEDDTWVESVLSNTYTHEEITVRSSVLIGCDGANSRVRNSSGITVDAEDGVETMMTIHFSADLRPVVKERVGMLHWIFDPAARGFIIAYDLSGNQVLIHNFDPTLHSLDSFTPEKCLDIIKAAIGTDIPVKFNSSLPWILRRQVANEYFRGRIVLAGDSAHNFPPTGGLGLNSGIADAHNLAYKIALVYNHQADLNVVLEAYEAERHPVAVRNSQQSVINGQKVFQLLKSLKNTGSDVELARVEMAGVLKDPVQRAEVHRLIQEQTEHFDNLMLHIGYVYEPHWSPANATDFVPAYRIGARLPHAWIRTLNGSQVAKRLPPIDLSYLAGDLSEELISTWRYSTLDLVPMDRFILICDSTSHWAKSYTQIEELRRATGIPMAMAVYGKSFEILEQKAAAAWRDGFGLDQGVAVIVRPDQHVALVVQKEMTILEVFEQLQRQLVQTQDGRH